MTNQRGLGRAVNAARGLWLGCGLVLAVGCGQEEPAQPADSTGQAYFPLVAGSWWEYAHSDRAETVTVQTADFNGALAFQMSDSPNSDGLRSDSIITSVDGRAARMTKQEYLVSATGETLTSSVSYGVGFTRFNESWANQAVGYTESPEYERVETAGGVEKAPEARRHTFEVISLDDALTTPKGTFRCIVIQRTKDWEEASLNVGEEAETKRYWFARGVGKVQELNVETGKAELLTDFSIPSQ